MQKEQKQQTQLGKMRDFLVCLVDIAIRHNNMMAAMIRSCFIEPFPRVVYVFLDKQVLSARQRARIRREFRMHATARTTVIVRSVDTVMLNTLAVFYRGWVHAGMARKASLRKAEVSDE